MTLIELISNVINTKLTLFENLSEGGGNQLRGRAKLFDRQTRYLMTVSISEMFKVLRRMASNTTHIAV